MRLKFEVAHAVFDPPRGTPPLPWPGGVFRGESLKIDKAWRARQPGRRRSGTIRVASPQATWHKPVTNNKNPEQKNDK